MKKLLSLFQSIVVLTGLSLTSSLPAWSQAALVPNAQQQFFDKNGNPLSQGKVYMTVPNTGVPKVTWKDPAQTQNNSNPILLDAGGWATIFGQGNYNQQVLDKDGNQIWSKPTAAYGSSAPSGATGTDTAPVGTIMPFSGFTIPINWQLAYGQAISRTGSPQLFATITIIGTGVNCISGSPILSNWADTSQMKVGAPVEASCVAPGTTISSITSSTSLTISANATATAVVTARVFPWGNGDGTFTFNVPDMRGRVAPGADAMGGTAASRLTSTYYGASASPPGVSGGSQSSTLAQANLPNINFSVSGITAHIANPTIIVYGAGGGTGNGVPQGTAQTSGPGITGAWTGDVAFDTYGTAASGGSDVAFANIQPSLTMNYIIKVTPNSTGLGGVVSIGGMFGDILCGANLLCANNTITFVGTGSGTVSSVGLSLPNVFSVSGSPITSTGIITASLVTQAANTVWAGPTSGPDSAPVFRNLIGSDFGNQTQNMVLASPDVTPGLPVFRSITANDLPGGLIGSCGYMQNMAISPVSGNNNQRWLIGPAFFVPCKAKGWNQDTSPVGGSVWTNSLATWVANVGQGGRGSYMQSLTDFNTYNGHGCSGINCVSSAGTYTTVTFSGASGAARVAWASHGLAAGRSVTFCAGDSDFYGPDCRYASPGTLPVGIVPNRVYFVCGTSVGVNAFFLSSTYDLGMAGTCDINITSNGSGTIKGNNGRMGGFDPDQAPTQPVANTVYSTYLVARTNNTGPNDWGQIIANTGCSAAGPGPTVQAVYPYWMCIDWMATNAAPLPTAYEFQTCKNNHAWVFCGGSGTGSSGTAKIAQFATEVQTQWTGVDLSSVFGGKLDHNTGKYTIAALVSTNTEFARVANNIHFGNFVPCGAVGVGGVAASANCTIVPDEGVIALWSNSLSTFYYLIGGESGF